MLDPYYRSIDGFRTLVEICWLDFGHKMADRNGTANGGIDPNERAPIFLQVCVFFISFIYMYSKNKINNNTVLLLGKKCKHSVN